MSKAKNSFLSNSRYFLKELIWKNPNLKPKVVLPSQKVNVAKIDRNKNQIIWLGHSANLVVLNRKIILLDPMLDKYASPIPGLYKRFEIEEEVDFSEIDKIDLAIFSHNHYDHLGKETVKKLSLKIQKYLVPEGMAGNLLKWGIPAERIKEVAWYENVGLGGLEVVATPAFHYSGRGIFDSNKSKCNSWVLKDSVNSLFLSGDSRYNQHFKEIGEEYGPFDFGLIECGQYDSHWPDSHMFPEESVQSAVDSHVNNMIPIHWAGFALGFHDWQEPVERALVKAVELDMRLTTPVIGQPVVFNEENKTIKWWRT